MRLLTVVFVSTEHFLSHYSDKASSGALFYRTRTELTTGEPVLMEIYFPGLPNRVLVRGAVADYTPGQGAWIGFHDHDSSTRDFLVAVARGEIEVRPKVGRSFDRFPMSLPVDITISSERLVTRTGDVGVGGAFIRTLTPPTVGTPVKVTIGPSEGAPFDTITLEGEVAWIRGSGDEKGFGVKFRDKTQLDHRLLRTALRRASEKGKVEFAS